MHALIWCCHAAVLHGMTQLTANFVHRWFDIFKTLDAVNQQGA